MGHTFFRTLLAGLFYLPFPDPQDTDTDSGASNTDWDSDDASEGRTDLNGWQDSTHKKLVSNFCGVNLTLRSPILILRRFLQKSYNLPNCFRKSKIFTDLQFSLIRWPFNIMVDIFSVSIFCFFAIVVVVAAVLFACFLGFLSIDIFKFM